MLAQAKSKVVEYFSGLIKEIDLLTETLLFRLDLTNDYKDKCVNIRKMFIEEIKKVEEVNLKRLETKDESRLDKNSLIFEQFCFMIYKKDFEFLYEFKEIDDNYGYLITVDKYMSKENLICYKEALKFYVVDPRTLSYAADYSKIFNINNNVSQTLD
jgi:hypothetical protein